MLLCALLQRAPNSLFRTSWLKSNFLYRVGGLNSSSSQNNILMWHVCLLHFLSKRVVFWSIFLIWPMSMEILFDENEITILDQIWNVKENKLFFQLFNLETKCCIVSICKKQQQANNRIDLIRFLFYKPTKPNQTIYFLFYG